MSLFDWLSLALICILGAASPGPSLAVVLAVSILHGQKGGYAAAIGHGIGVFFYAMIAAASLSYILKQHANLFQAEQIAGALLLMWIGGRLLLSTQRQTQDQLPRASSLVPSQSFRHGFAIAFFNPKIAVFSRLCSANILVKASQLGFIWPWPHLLGALI